MTDTKPETQPAVTSAGIRELLGELTGALDGDFGDWPQGRELVRQVAALLARPIPDVTRNASYTVRAVMSGHPAEPGLLASWWVAAESDADNQWVTWEAYALDGSQAGRLGFNAGHYFGGPDQAVNKRGALADLAVRAGTMPEMAHRIADEVMRYAGNVNSPAVAPEDKRMANRLRKWASR